MTVKHSFVSPVTDGGDASLVGPDEWNANHSIVADLSPDTNDGASLGTTLKQWSDLFLASGGVLNWANGAYTITESLGVLKIAVSGTNVLQMDDLGRVVLSVDGTVASDIFWEASISPAWQILGTGGLSTGFGIARYENSASSARLFIGKSRSASIGQKTVVQNGDTLGVIDFQGTDGTYFVQGATIRAVVDGTPGSLDMPTRLVLSTVPDGAHQVVDRLILDNQGNTALGTGALNTNATDGFLYVPTCAGAPSGSPTSYTGRVPLVYDSTNNKLYVYNGGWKASGVFA